ncbi:MAG: hypothetical protein Q7J28_02665 [Caulobacter sp.]|nr:hypothetical protein [Caulobacter sp.]
MMRERGATISLRVRPDLKDRLDAASAAHPYRPSLTAILERGAELALVEMAEQLAAMRDTKGPA